MVDSGAVHPRHWRAGGRRAISTPPSRRSGRSFARGRPAVQHCSRRVSGGLSGRETLIRESNRFNVAVGITRAVRGEVVIDRANPRASQVGPITVDISQFPSDSQRRDGAIRERWLESARFPMAEFTPLRIDGLPAQYTEGREIAVQVTGNLKVRDVVKPVTFTTVLKLLGPQLTGTATAKILMTDFGFDPPAIFGILRAQNEAAIEFRFVAAPAP